MAPLVSAPAADPLDPAARLEQLREALSLIERIAGRAAPAPASLLDQADRASARARAEPIRRRRHDALIADATAIGARGLAALLHPGERPHAAAVARRLADDLRRSLDRADALLLRPARAA